MNNNTAEIGELKRKLRKLKQLERKIRFGGETDTGSRLVWDTFFDLRGNGESGVKYPQVRLAAMARVEYKRVIDEFFAHVYYEYYKENGFDFEYAQTRGGAHTQAAPFAPSVLAQLDLPYDAGIAEIKKRFRELAKKYHPDTGGDAEKFIGLMRIYELLTGK